MSNDRTGIQLTPIWAHQTKLVDKALHFFHLDSLLGTASHLVITVDGVESKHEIDVPSYFFAMSPGEHTFTVSVEGSAKDAVPAASLRVTVALNQTTEVVYVGTAHALATSSPLFEARQCIRLELSFPPSGGNYFHADPDSTDALWTVHAMIDGVVHTSEPGASHRFPCPPGSHEVLVFFTPKGLGTLFHWNYGMEKIRVAVPEGGEAKITYKGQTTTALPSVPDWWTDGKRSLTLG